MINSLQGLLVILCGVSWVDAQTPTTIPTPFGPITGLIHERSREFRGLPFTNPTRRWEPPAPITPWTNPVDATRNRFACPQNTCTGPECPDAGVGEDCLFLTIHTPLPETITEPLPVMVWLHGGNFIGGAGSVLLYDGTHFANQTNVITVGVNYRLGALGYMQLPEAGIAGNMGLLDQIAALKFVHEAIEAFGGDPNQVTLFGQSAGGTSIGALKTAPADHPVHTYFQKTIVESNPFGLKIRTPETAAAVAQSFLRASPCESGADDLRACLDRMTVAEIRSAQQAADADIDYADFIANFYKWTPIVDGELVLGQPLTLWRANEINDMPIMMGHTSEEGVFYGPLIFETPMARSEYIEIATLLFPDLPLLDAYPPEDCLDEPVEDCREQINLAITHYIWICPMRSMMRGMAQGLQGPLYQYIYDHAWSFNGWGNGNSRCIGRVCHGAELPFVWNACFVPDRYPSDLQCDNSPEWRELDLGTRMGSSWGAFANTNDPYTDLLNPWKWEQFGAGEGEDNYMVFDSQNTGPVNRLLSDICDMHDDAGYHPEVFHSQRMTRQMEALQRAGWAGENRMGKPRTLENFRRWLNETRGPFN